MTEEKALEYATIASQKAINEFEKQNSIRFILQPKTSSVYKSKIGGIPYFPKGAEIPLDSDGNQLRFLMQINCDEIKDYFFVKKGIIQFWIGADDCWSMCDKKGFRVIYYEDISENSVNPPISEFTDEEKEYFPLYDEFGVEFIPSVEDIPKDSYKYQKLFCKYFNELSGENIESPYDLEFKLKLSFKVLSKAIYEGCSSYGHKIGGSSDFCQFDPRDTDELKEKYDFQLLQMESDYGRINGKNYENIMWGDSGVCHFFINYEKLKKLDFSDILYYCDCC